MIGWSLEEFVNTAVARGEISRADVRVLQRDILPNGIESRDEADVLIALDRAVHDKDVAWSAYAVSAVVEFVVWASRPTGRVDRETAQWLVQSLGCGTGPTENAARIAFEVVRESQQVDEVLLAFTLSALRRPWLRSPARPSAVVS